MSEASDIDTTVAPRVSRMSALCPPKDFGAADVMVIGAGAVGRQVALQLAAMGVGKLTVADFDTVGPENYGPQQYPPAANGRNKAEVTAEDCRRLNPDVQVTALPRRLAKSDFRLLEGRVVVFTVDSIDVRAALFEAACRGKARAVLDARVQGESLRIIAQPDPTSTCPYAGKDVLFPGSEAVRGLCAGSRMSTYGAATAASLLSAKVAQYLRGSSAEFTDHSLHLGSWDLLETPSSSPSKGER